MGCWVLEVFKMGIYIMFPVGMFYYCNQPEVYERWRAEWKAEFEKSHNEEETRILKKFIEDCRHKEEMKQLESLEQSLKKK